MSIVKKAVGKIAKDVVLSYAIEGTLVTINAAEKAVSSVCELVDKHQAKIAAKEKNNGIIRLAKAAYEYTNMRYTDVEEELKAYGFTNITLLPRRDLYRAILDKKKDGTVTEVSIGGNNRFGQKTKFNSDDKVIVIYHAFN